MRGRIHSIGRFLAPRMPAILLAWAFGCLVFLYGYQVGFRRWYPWGAIDGARVAAHIIGYKVLHYDRIRADAQLTAISPEEGKKYRVVVKQPVSDDADFLLNGGEGQYLEYCPQH